MRPFRKIALALAVAVFVLASLTTVLATLTSITLNDPANNAFIGGNVILNATLTSGDSATSVSFYNSSDGVTWSLICTNTTGTETFTCLWNTGSYNQNSVQVNANGTNGSVNVENTNFGITVDNIAPIISDIKNTSITETSALILWNTTENFPNSGSNSTVKYSNDSLDLNYTASDINHVTAHSVSLAGLTENTTYYYNVSSCDKVGNCNMSSTYSFTTVPGAFRVIPGISSPFKSFTFGASNNYNITIYNDKQSSDSYTISANLTNYSSVSGWSTAVNQSSMALGSQQNSSFELTLTAPMNAGAYVTVNVSVTSASGLTNYTIITFTPATLSLSTSIPISITNTTHQYVNGTKLLNFTGFSYSSDAENLETNPPRVTCGLYTNASNMGSLTKAGTFNTTTKTCVMDVTTGVSAGNYYFVILLNTSKNQYISASTSVSAPSLINVNLTSTSVLPGGAFYVNGTAKYDTNQTVFGINNVNTSYDGSQCSGSTASGILSFLCTAPLTSGTYTLTAVVNGVWNINGSGTATLTVRNLTAERGQLVTIIPSSNTVTLEEGRNSTVAISVLNSYDVAKTFTIDISEVGDYNHFDLVYNRTLAIGSNATKSFNLLIVPYRYLKTGSFPVKISIASEGVEKTITVRVSFTTEPQEINMDRYYETRSGKTKVGINVTSTKFVSMDFNVTETIPKTLATSVSDIVFSVQPNVTLQQDPIVLWDLVLNPNDSIVLEYTIPGIVSQAVMSDPITSINRIFLPPSLNQSGEEISAESISEDLRPLYIAVIFTITALAVIIILFKGEVLGFKKKPKPAFMQKAEKGSAENLDFGEEFIEERMPK